MIRQQTEPSALISTFPLPASSLSQHKEIPAIGFGTYRLPHRDSSITPLIECALECGYSLIDTAQVYRNQSKIGDALKQIPSYRRDRVFITSKLGMTNLGDKTTDAIKDSLKELQVDYIDLFLIHWPGAAKLPPHSEKHQQRRKETYRQLQQAQKNGLIRSWGISNFQLRHLQELECIGEPGPAVHQMEIHPLYFEATKEIREWCTKRGIHVQAYSSFGGGELDSNVQFMKDVEAITGRDAHESLLMWALGHGFSILPKSAHPDRIRRNRLKEKLPLTSDQIAQIDQLSSKHGQKKLCWDSCEVA